MRVNEWNMQKPLAALGMKDTGVGIRRLGFPPWAWNNMGV